VKTYTLEHIQTGRAKDLNEDVFILLLHAGRVPPHIGMVAAGLYHSLSVKGQDLDVPLETLLKSISLRKIPTLFIKLNAHPEFDVQTLSDRFKTEVMRYKRVDVGVATCLSPLKSFFSANWQVNTSELNYLYELLPVLEEQSILGTVLSLNMDSMTESGCFTLPYYTMNEINNGIEAVRSEYN
jgi:hypothetical protein